MASSRTTSSRALSITADARATSVSYATTSYTVPMAYRFLCTKGIVCAEIPTTGIPIITTRSKASSILFQRIDVTLHTGKIDHTFCNYRSALHRASQPGPPKNLSISYVHCINDSRLNPDYRSTHHRRRSDYLPDAALPYEFPCPNL